MPHRGAGYVGSSAPLRASYPGNTALLNFWVRCVGSIVERVPGTSYVGRLMGQENTISNGSR